MKVIVRPRQCGKTTDLLKLANEHQALIITHNHYQADHLWKEMVSMGWSGRKHTCQAEYDEVPKPVSWESLPCSIKSTSYRAVVIDNIDLIIKHMLNKHGLIMTPLVGLTVSGIPEVFYDEMRDMEQFEDFKNTNPELTYPEFCKTKYGVEYDHS